MPHIDVSYRRVLRLTSPVLLTQLSHTSMGLVDTVMVGRLGVLELGAVGLGSILTWWLLSFFFGLLTGVNTFVAQAFGAGEHRQVGVLFWQAIYLALLCALLIGVMWPFAPMVFSWTHTSPEMQRLATEYSQIRLLGGVGLALLLSSDNFYRGLGRTDVPMWCALGQVVVNCGLNYLLIFGKAGLPALGVAGAAWGTVIAQLVAASALLLCVLGRREWRSRFFLATTFKPAPAQLSEMLRVSLPIGVQVFMEMGGISVFTAVVARLGEAQMAATNAVIQAWSLAFMAAFALSVGATTLVGQCLGAGELASVRRAVSVVMRLGLLLTGLIGLVYLAVPELLISLFVSAADVDRLTPYARPLFTVVVVCLFFDLRFNVLSGALRGAGDTRYSMMVNVASAWLLFVPLTVVLAARFGVVGAWWALAAHVAMMAALLEVRYRGASWMHRLVSPEGLPRLPAAAHDGASAVDRS